MTTRDHPVDPDDIVEEVRQRLRRARRDQVRKLIDDIDENDLPQPTHYCDEVH